MKLQTYYLATISYNHLCLFSIQKEIRLAELETNLSTNLVRREQDLETLKFSKEPEFLYSEAEVKRHALREAKFLIDEVTQKLESKFQYPCTTSFFFCVIRYLNLYFHQTKTAECSEEIEKRTRKLKDVKDEKHKLKVVFFLGSNFILFSCHQCLKCSLMITELGR